MDKSELARPRDAASHIRALEARIGELEEKNAGCATLFCTYVDEIERLVADSAKLIDGEPVAHCEGCGAWLLADDDFVSGDDVSGCWAAMTDLPSKRERPCYAYRVGKKDARQALENGK